MKFVNESSQRVRVPELGIDVQPGETCEVPEHHARPGRHTHGARKPSDIECLAPQLKPADQAEREIWLQAPKEPQSVLPPPKAPTVQQLVAAGHPPGVAEIMAAAAAAPPAKGKKPRPEAKE